jgi:hypothetical protein
MGFFKRSSAATSPSSPGPFFPEQGTVADTIPGIDEPNLTRIEHWLDTWDEAGTQKDGQQMIRQILLLGSLMGSQGVSATFRAVSSGIDGGAPRQRVWRWLGAASVAARQRGDTDMPPRIFMFMDRYARGISQKLQARDEDALITVGIDRPTGSSELLIIDEAIAALETMDPERYEFVLPGRPVSVREVIDTAQSMRTSAAQRASSPQESGRPSPFIFGSPLTAQQWSAAELSASAG